MTHHQYDKVKQLQRIWFLQGLFGKKRSQDIVTKQAEIELAGQAAVKNRPHLDDSVIYDASMLARLAECKDKCWAYNQIRPSDDEARAAAIRGILGRRGEKITILPNFWCDIGSNIFVGERFFANHGLTILDGARVTFGDDVFIGPDCGFYTVGHSLDPARRNMGLEIARPISVGDSVWFGGHVTVCPGVTIGSNVTIGAGSVVISDIPPNVLAAGNPCRVVRTIRSRN